MLFTIVSNDLKLLYLFTLAGTKVFKTIYGYGIYEGQCDKEGNTCGEGRWVCTEPNKFTDHRAKFNYKGVTFFGCFRNDAPDGFGEFDLTLLLSLTFVFLAIFFNPNNGGTKIAEYLNGICHGKCT